MNDDKNTSGTSTETPPAPYKTPGQDEKTTEGRKEERSQDQRQASGHGMNQDSNRDDRSKDADNKGQNGNPAQSAGRVSAEEQDDAPDAKIAFEGKEAKHLGSGSDQDLQDHKH